MKKLLIITDLSFPQGSAMASRIKSFCYLFNDIGYDVHVISGKLESKDVIYNKIINEDVYSYEVVKSNRSYRMQSYFGNENLARVVDNYLKNNLVDLVFMTSLNANFVKVFNICKKYNKKIILEQCEWYDQSSFTLKKYDLRYLRFINNIAKEYIKVDGVISISRLLNDYYLNKKCKTIRIPSILNIDNKPYNVENKNKKINLVYTGNASKSKELIEPILIALNSKNEYYDKFEFNIYGLNNIQLLEKVSDKSLIKDNIIAHGNVAQDKIEGILLEADYQIFIRPNRRSSNAGFPTKLAESMAVGTPVISNDTGDICLYLKDGINGYVCKGINPQDICDDFDRIIKEQKYCKLRKNARKTAEDYFNYKKYIDVMKDFINTL